MKLSSFHVIVSLCNHIEDKHDNHISASTKSNMNRTKRNVIFSLMMTRNFLKEKVWKR